MLNLNSPRRSARFSLLALIAIFMLSSPLLLAQTTLSTGSIGGTVTDATGAVISGAKVTITNTQTGQTSDFSTNTSGGYASGPLNPGNYKVQISQKGFRTVTSTVVVQVGNTTTVNSKLEIGLESQVVEVQASSVTVNTEQPTVQGVLTANQIESLPVSGRNFLDLAQLEPGVQIQDGGNFDPTKNGFSSISFGGRFGRTARIEVDGLDISDETVGTTTQNISAGAIEEFQISQSTLDLSTELTSSGAVNIVTKSGTNSFHGEGFYLFRDKSMAANFPGGADTYYQRNHSGGSFGGPILKDKLFFFVNAEHIKQDLIVPLAPPSPFQDLPKGYSSPFRDTVSMGRLDYNLKGTATLFYKFNYETNSDSAAYGATYQPFANRDNTPSHAIGVNFNTGTYTHSIRWGYFKFQNHIADAVASTGVYDPAKGIANIAIRIGGASTVTRFGPSRLAPQATFQTNNQIKYDGSKSSGKHIFHYGVSFNHIQGGGFASFYGIAGEARASLSTEAQNFAADSCDPNYGTPLQSPIPLPCFPGGSGNPLNYAITTISLGNGQGFFTEVPRFGYPAGGQGDNRLGLYFGDVWRIRRNLSASLGLRWSRDTGRSDSDVAPNTCDQIVAGNFGGNVPCTGSSLILDQFGTGLGARVRQPNSNFSPQVGFAWDVKSNGKTVIRAGAGIYYENAVFNNVLFDRPGRLAKGLFWSQGFPICPGGTLTVGATTITSVDGVDLATGVCGQPIGSVAVLVQDLETLYQTTTAAAGTQGNPNFIGQTLANGPNSTGNNFIAPNYRTPRSYQMNIGFQHELRPGTVVSADFLRNIGERYLLSYDTNHIGDARYLNKNAAANAISTTLSNCGVATITQSYSGNCPTDPASGTHGDGTYGTPANPARPAIIDDFAGAGLDSGHTYLSGYPASVFGLTPDTGAAFGGINPAVGENDMLFPIGRSTYTGLDLVLRQNITNPVPHLKAANFQVSYSYSEFNAMTGDQDFVNDSYDYAQPTRYYGPSSLDRRHQLSVGGTFDLFNRGPRLSFITHIFSPLSQTLTLLDQGRAGEIFHTDLIGDGSNVNGKILPGTNIGSFGRTVKGNNINNVINKYNSTVAGTLTPAGQALVSAGLFTQAQLVSLGAVADSVPLAPQGQSDLSWLKTFDFKFSWPIKLRERFTIEPAVGFFNVFNLSNFNSPSNLLSGILDGSAGSANGTTKGTGGLDSVRVGVGTGVNQQGAPRQIEWSLKLTF